MPQGGFQSEKDFQDFQALNPMQQLKYLHATDPDFGKLSVEQQGQYVDSILGKEVGKEQSFGDKLTAGGSSEGAQKGDEWLSKNVPIAGPVLGKGLRAFDAAGGAVMGLPSFLYHSVADPLSPQEQANGQGRLEAIPERLLGAEQTATALKDYGAGKVSPSGAMSVLPEALGTGIGVAGATKGLGLAKEGFGKITEPVQSAIADKMRYPATQAQAEVGRPGTIKNFLPPSMQRWSIPDWTVPKGEKGSPTNPGPFAKIPLKVPRSAAMEAEAEAPVTTPAPGARLGGRMNRPFLPVIATPEDMQIFQNQMGILKPEAQAAGMYSAARGATRAMPDYQMRIGGKLRPFGPPEDLMEESTPPVRRKVENE